MIRRICNFCQFWQPQYADSDVFIGDCYKDIDNLKTTKSDDRCNHWHQHDNAHMFDNLTPKVGK